MDEQTIITFILLGIAAAGGLVALYRLVEAWYYSTAFRVTFDDRKTRYHLKPEQTATVGIVITNRCHRPVAIQRVALYGPAQVVVDGLTIENGELKPLTTVKDDVNPGSWGTPLLPAMMMNKVDAQKVGIRLRAPPFQGDVVLRVVLRPENERPFYASLTLRVKAN